jgi:hypothetical protein
MARCGSIANCPTIDYRRDRGKAGVESIRFTFDGEVLEGRRGESLAAALVAAGITGFRATAGGEARSLFCGMGVCQDCLVDALVAAGITGFRATAGGEARSLFCGMGVCQDCLVEVDGRPNQRACMTKLDRPLAVRREAFGRAPAPVVAGAPPRLIDTVPEERPEILVIGAGPAGLSAAIAARRAGAAVTVVDERPAPGGQYF